MLMPMALLIRELSDDWRVLSPTVLLRAVGRGGPSYVKMALVIFGLMLPALLTCLVTLGSHFYLQIMVGTTTVRSYWCLKKSCSIAVRDFPSFRSRTTHCEVRYSLNVL